MNVTPAQMVPLAPCAGPAWSGRRPVWTGDRPLTARPAVSLPQRLEVLVSLRKGTVVRTSGSMAELLGYPPDMWVGRNFIDYIYPRDRASFTNTINGMGVDVNGLISNKGGRRDARADGERDAGAGAAPVVVGAGVCRSWEASVKVVSRYGECSRVRGTAHWCSDVVQCRQPAAWFLGMTSARSLGDGAGLFHVRTLASPHVCTCTVNVTRPWGVYAVRAAPL